MLEVRITAKRGKKGTWPYKVGGRLMGGFSRQPLLDACRQLKAMGEPEAAPIGLFWLDSTVWSVRTTVGAGAALTVEETDRGIRFRRFRDFRPWES